MRDWDIAPGGTYMVGDAASDILAGKAAGSTALFVSDRKCYVCDELSRQNARPDFLTHSLLEAAEVIECLENNTPAAARKFNLENCLMR